MAHPLGADYGVARKHRSGDRQVEVHLPALDYKDRTVVLVDDMISTGRTLISVANTLREEGAGAIHCLVTHALCDARAMRELNAAGIAPIWSCDTLTHTSNAVMLTTLLAESLSQLH